MKKSELLEHWARLSVDDNAIPPIRSVAYKHEGSTYGEDSIRVTGTPKFIDWVSSRLKPLLRYEANTTRLQIAHSEIMDSYKDLNTGKRVNTKEPTGDYAAYIQVHQRGPQAQMANLIVEGARHREAVASCKLDGDTIPIE